MPNYIKSNLIADIAETTGLPQAEVSAVLDNVIVNIKNKTSEGLVVNLTGLGRFEQKTRKARTGRNPATGESIQIPETQYLHFKAAKSKS